MGCTTLSKLEETPVMLWETSPAPVPYLDAVTRMERHVEAMLAGAAPEMVWLLEHPPLYTAGTSAKAQDLLTPDRFPVFKTGRGGQYTYHGPGQRVAYAMIDLSRRCKDVRAYVAALERWLITALAQLGHGEVREGRVGIWVPHGGREDKIAAIGVRVRRWITFHGVSLNVDPDLSHFDGIVPCGIHEHGVTSLRALGSLASMADVDVALKAAFEGAFAGKILK